MADTTQNRIAAARRAMEQVVLPAVDPDHPLAREQAELVASTLRLLEEQLPYRRERTARELARNLDLGRALLEVDACGLRAELAAAVAAGEALLAELGPSDAELAAAVTELTAVSSAVVRAAADAPAAERAELVGLVLARSAPVVTDRRAWLAPQGWGSADGVPSLAEAFGPADPPRPREDR